MAYSATSRKVFAEKAGTLTEKITDEFAAIEAALIHAVDLTPSKGTDTTLATTGVDLAVGATVTYYGVFIAPADIEVISLVDVLTEAYVKNGADAKIEVYNDAASPAKIFGRTLTAAGELAKAVHTTSPESGKAAIAKGTRLDLKITGTGDTSGTGHAKVTLMYKFV